VSAAFARRQRVRIQTLAGPDFTPAWNERGAVVRPDGNRDGWYIVQFDDGGRLSIHASRLMASDETLAESAARTDRRIADMMGRDPRAVVAVLRGQAS
jgi:hypothetical protein